LEEAVMGFQPKKIFTVAEARQTLPLVRKIVSDILNQSYESHIMANIMGQDAHNHPQILEKMDSVQELITELEDIGCYYKDWSFQIGLVDFPAKIDDRLVFLCWRSDEKDIIYYHDLQAGFVGRKTIPDEYR